MWSSGLVLRGSRLAGLLAGAWTALGTASGDCGGAMLPGVAADRAGSLRSVRERLTTVDKGRR